MVRPERARFGPPRPLERHARIWRPDVYCNVRCTATSSSTRILCNISDGVRVRQCGDITCSIQAEAYSVLYSRRPYRPARRRASDPAVAFQQLAAGSVPSGNPVPPHRMQIWLPRWHRTKRHYVTSRARDSVRPRNIFPYRPIACFARRHACPPFLRASWPRCAVRTASMQRALVRAPCLEGKVRRGPASRLNRGVALGVTCSRRVPPCVANRSLIRI